MLIEELIGVSQSPSVIIEEPLEIKEDFLEEWINYTVDLELTFFLDNNTDNVIFDETGATGIRFYGKAPPNQEIKVLIFSDPYEVTAISNENGDWSASLNEPLVAGEHDAYLYYMDPNQDYYRLEKELMLTVDLDNRNIFSNLNILPESGAATTLNGIIATLLILFGTFMIVVAVAGFNKRQTQGGEAVEVLPRYSPNEGSSVTIVKDIDRYI